MKTNTFSELPSGEGHKYAIVRARFNEAITGRMLEACIASLVDAGVKDSDIRVVEVPGSYEIPLVADKLAQSGADAVITLGCILKGETTHDIHISNGTIPKLTDISLKHQKPIILGIITPLTQEQADTRSMGEGNKGIEAAHAALEMVDLLKSF